MGGLGEKSERFFVPDLQDSTTDGTPIGRLGDRVWVARIKNRGELNMFKTFRRAAI